MKKSYPGFLQTFGIFGIYLCLVIFLYSCIPSGNTGGIWEFLQYLFTMGGTFAIAYWIRLKLTGVKVISFRLSDWKIIPLICMGALSLLWLEEFIPVPSTEFWDKMMMELVEDMVQNTDFWSFMSMVIAAPVIEELLFRGIVLDGFLKRYPVWVAIALSAFMFGVFHFNPYQLIGGFTTGCFIGWIYYHTRSVLPCIIIHACMNSAGFFSCFFLSADSVAETLESSQWDIYKDSGMLIRMVVLLIVTGLVIWLLDYLLKRKSASVLPED